MSAAPFSVRRTNGAGVLGRRRVPGRRSFGGGQAPELHLADQRGCNRAAVSIMCPTLHANFCENRMFHRSVGVALGAAVLAALVAQSRVAGAETTDDAEKLIRHGIELRKAHDDEGAARAFQQAYDQVHTPRAAGQLGLAEQALGRWEDAERHVGEALRTGGDPWVAKNRATLDEALGIDPGASRSHGDHRRSRGGRGFGQRTLCREVAVAGSRSRQRRRGRGRDPRARLRDGAADADHRGRAVSAPGPAPDERGDRARRHPRQRPD